MSRESMSSMMSDECQGMCSIDMSLCSLVFVRIFMLSDQGLLIRSDVGSKTALCTISEGQKKGQKYMQKEKNDCLE